MVWTGEAQSSVRQIGMAQNGIAYIGAVDYIGVFQFGPLSGKVPMTQYPSGSVVAREGVMEADWYAKIDRKPREVFYVSDSDWNPFMQHIAKMTNSDFTDTGAGYGSFEGG